MHEPEARLRDVDPDPDLVRLEDRRDGLAGGDEVARAEVDGLDHAVGGRAHDEVLALALQIVELSLLPNDGGAGRRDVLRPIAALLLLERLERDAGGGRRRVVGLLADDTVLEQGLLAAPLRFGVLRVGLRAGDVLLPRAAQGLLEVRARRVETALLGPDLLIEEVCSRTRRGADPS